MAQGFSIQSLNKAGANALFPNATKFFNENATPIITANNNETDYDLLDDKTGLPKGTEAAFRQAAVLDSMKSKMDQNYVPSVVAIQQDNPGEVLYQYDSNKDGNYDTFVQFKDGAIEKFGKKDETAGMGYMLVDYGNNTYLYDEPNSYDSVLHNYFPEIYEGEYGKENNHFGKGISYSEHTMEGESRIGLWYDHYNVTYNEDGTVEDLSIPENPYYNGI